VSSKTSLQNPIFIKQSSNQLHTFTPGFKQKALNTQMMKQSLISSEKMPSRGALQQDRGIFGSGDRSRAAVSN
jgi:hypothetical protein